MNSIRELRARCQSVHADDVSARIVRAVSIYFTAALIPTGISANAISVVNVAIAVIAGVLIALGTPTAIVIGLGAFTINTILDGVDGEIARYRRQSSLTGLFADRINSIFAYPALFGGLGMAAFRMSHSSVAVVVGLVTAWASIAVRLVKTTLDTTLVDALTQEKARQEAPVAVTAKFVSLSEQYRHRSPIAWLLDFVLFRQPGVNLAVAGGVLGALMLFGSQRAAGFAMSALVGIYGTAYSLATVLGMFLIIRSHRAEAAFAELQTLRVTSPKLVDSR